MVLNYLRNWDIPEVAFSSPNVFPSACIRINIRFRERNLYILQSHTVKLKMEMLQTDFTVFLNFHENITFKN